MAKKILVVAAAGIGDCLIATPLIHELRANFPDSEIHALVVWKGSRDFLEDNPHLNAIHQKNLVTDSTFSSLRYLAGLRRHHYDISINAHPQGRIHYRILARIVGARLRVSHAYENSGWWDRFLVHHSIPQDYQVHSVENNNRLLPLLGARPVLSQHTYELFLRPSDTEWADAFATHHQLKQGPILGLHLGSGGTKNLRLKRWPFPLWRELIERLVRKRPEAAIVMFGGPQEKAEHEQILEAMKGQRVLAPVTANFRQAAALMKQCHAFISVDTVMMHLAAAMKVPNQLVIEAPTLNPTNVPWQNAYQLIPNPAIQGRHLEYYRYDGRPIRGTDAELTRLMSAVTVDAVEKAVLEALE